MTEPYEIVKVHKSGSDWCVEYVSANGASYKIYIDDARTGNRWYEGFKPAIDELGAFNSARKYLDRLKRKQAKRVNARGVSKATKLITELKELEKMYNTDKATIPIKRAYKTLEKWLPLAEKIRDEREYG